MTSASPVSREIDKAFANELFRARLKESAGISSLSIVLTCVGAFCVAFAIDVADARAQSACARDRDAHGVGRVAALSAMDTPKRKPSFLYRVARDDGGYRVRVVVKDGPFLGDTWERDAEGRIKHVFDVCREAHL
jgi:hypothetical protein